MENARQDEVFRVFLVDDEIVIREGIREGFPWDETPFNLVGEAPDGEMAFPMINDLKPDILITDIRMPFMDGLALSRKVAQALPWTSIIILSGHDDFEYARQAIDIGVRQYLLKPITPKKLGEALFSMAQKIREERARQADMALLRSRLESSARYAREQLLLQLLTGSFQKELLSKAQELGMSLVGSRYLVMLLGSSGEEDQLPLISSLQHVVEGQEGNACFVTGLDSPALMLIAPEGSFQGEDIEERAYALAQALRHEASQQRLPLPAIAIGSPVSRLQDLPQALASAQAVLRSMAGQPPRIAGSLDIDLSATWDLAEGSMLPLYERLLYAPAAEGARLVEDYYGSMGDYAAQSLLVQNFLLMDVLLAATRVIRQCGGEPSRVLPPRLIQQSELLKLSSHAGKALAAAQEIIQAALSYRDAHAVSRYGEILRKACAYIDAHFHNPGMTLQDVAGHVALSNNHFSTVFSQEMGQTFTEYLTRVRMERAKQLLGSTADRSAQISLAVGYNDPHYFSYLFKKQVGMSPRDFRRSLGQGTG